MPAETPYNPRRRAALVTWACWVVPGEAAAVVATAILVAAHTGPLITLVAAVGSVLVVGSTGGAWALWRAVRVDRALGGRPASEKTEPRLFNLVEGLCAGAGVRPPQLRVLEDPGLNAAAAGRGEASAVLTVTSGLLDGLNRIELEGLLAYEVVRFRRGEVLAATVASAAGPWAASVAAPPGAELWSDRGAVALTRYPPGLARALEKICDRGSSLRSAPRAGAYLWIADPTPSGSPSKAARLTRVPLEERIEALCEL